MDFKINKTVFNGRPGDFYRLPKETAVYDMLDSLGVSFIRLDHDAADSIELCDEVGMLLDVKICKNLFLCNRQQTKFYLLMMPGDKPFKTKDLTNQIGSSRLSFAPHEYMENYLNITPGSVSVLGLMNDTENHVSLLIDKDLLNDEYFGCHPCINTSSLKIKNADLFNRILPFIKHTPTFVML